MQSQATDTVFVMRIRSKLREGYSRDWNHFGGSSHVYFGCVRWKLQLSSETQP